MDTIHAYVQLKEILRHNSFVAIHSHTPIAAAVCRWAAKKYRRKGTNIIYTVHGFFFHRGSSKKSWIIYRSIEWFLARYTDAIITINKEDFKRLEIDINSEDSQWEKNKILLKVSIKAIIHVYQGHLFLVLAL